MPTPPLPTVLLRHDTPDGGFHYDWMVARPDDDGVTSPLWTARVDRPWREWADAGTVELTPLPPHRRHYLTYEGPLRDHRGRVTRIAAGTVAFDRFTDTGFALTLRDEATGMTLRITASADTPTRWSARITPT